MRNAFSYFIFLHSDVLVTWPSTVLSTFLRQLEILLQ